MSTILDNSNITSLQKAFIIEYVNNGFNGKLAIQNSGYKYKSDTAASKQASALLSKSEIREEIQRLIKEKEDAKVASATEVLQFYTSVMRGQILDQFGIEASLDTRIKAANELAKHQIEIPMKLEQKNITNNIGSIQLNFLPRTQEIV